MRIKALRRAHPRWRVALLPFYELQGEGGESGIGDAGALLAWLRGGDWAPAPPS
jgi:hypothetical protein